MENQDKKPETTLITNPNQAGFSSQIIPVLIIALLMIGSFSLVLTANPHKTTPQSVNLTSNSTGASSKSSSSAQSNSTVSTATPLPTATSTPAKITPAAPSPSSRQPNTTPSAPASGYTSTTTTVTPLAALTTIISKLDVGESEAEVTVQPIAIPGPIGTATGHPIVFTVNGKTYYAYTQGKAPDFSLTPSQTANTMAIVNGSATVSLEPAYLDKLGNLVDVDYQAVGFSTGGN